MTNKGANIFSILQKIYQLQKKYQYQRQFTANLLQKYKHWQPNDGTLKAKDLRRMNDYPLQFIVFFADLFALLRKKPLSLKERTHLTQYAAMLCLYDDFFDEGILSDEAIWQLYQNPADFQPSHTKQAVCRDLLLDLFRSYPKTAHFDEVFWKFHQAQIQSRKQQQDSPLTQQEILKISFDKGGLALLLSRLLMDNPLLTNESDTVYALGAWYQLLDDIVDVAKDYREGVATLLTTSKEVQHIKQALEQQTSHAFEALLALGYDKGILQQVIQYFSIIGTSGWVHLQRLQKLQGKGRFALENYAEKDIQWVETRLSNYYHGLKLMLSHSNTYQK